MNLNPMNQRTFSRREALRRTSLGFGSLALAGLMNSRAFGAGLPPGAPHFAPRAKRVIFAYMSGGVSHVDSFDPKPALKARHGQPMPVPVKPTMFNNNGNIMASPWEAKPRGQSGVVMTDLFPKLAGLADDLAVIRSMTTKVNEHAQGNYAFHTSFPFMGHPSAGAWVSYGLGVENENLPGFVVLQAPPNEPAEAEQPQQNQQPFQHGEQDIHVCPCAECGRTRAVVKAGFLAPRAAVQST